jgi:hypothetical protein
VSFEEPCPVNRSWRVSFARKGFFREYGVAAMGVSMGAAVKNEKCIFR